MKKCTKQLTLILATVLLFITPLFTTTASASTTPEVYLSVYDYFAPERPAWSWAAGIQTVTRCFSSGRMAYQDDLVNAVTPYNIDAAVSKTKIQKAITSFGIAGTYSTSKIALNKMRSSINNGSPILGFYSGDDNITHSIIIYGYRYGSSHKTVTYLDVSTNTNYTVSYASLFSTLPNNGRWMCCLYDIK